jgi:hypothetical protein
MNDIKSIADFKRAMVVGSVWEALHEYINNNPTPPKNLGIRRVGHVQSNRFAFETVNGELSWCSWPKKSQFSTEDNGNTVVITTDFCRLRYTEQA